MSSKYLFAAPLLAAFVFAIACSSSSVNSGSTSSGPTPVAGTSSAPRTGNAVVYSAQTSGHYRLDSRDSLAMEMPDGSFQRTVLVKRSYLTISMVPGANGLGATIVLDSMMLDRPNSMFQPLIDSAQGTQWKGTLTASGHFDSLVANHPSLFGEQIRTMLNRLMPILPPGGAEPGKSWADSVTVPFHLMAGFTAMEERRIEYRAGRSEEVRGVRTLPIQSTISYKVSGSGSAMGPEIHMEGSGAASGTHRLSYAGRLIEASVTDSAGLTLTVPAAGQTVPATLIATYSLSVTP